MDAAELQFSLYGFHATSVREIFKAAGMNPGLMTYYFASKDELFHEVILRRIPDVRREFDLHFPATRNDGEPISVEAYWKFYLWFFLAHLPRIEGGFREYWNLISRSSISYENAIVRASLAELDFIALEMTVALKAALPGVSEQDIKGILLFAEAAVTTINATPGLSQHRLGPDFDLSTYIDQTGTALAHGLMSMGTTK